MIINSLNIIEFAVVGFIIWGVFNEQKLVNFEETIKKWLHK